MVDKSREAKAAAEAKKQYDSVSTDGSGLNSLIKAVKSAQAAKGKTKGKRELKAQATIAKAEAAQKREAEAAEALRQALEAELKLAADTAEAQIKAARMAETRARREQTASALRASRAAASAKVVQLKKTVDMALRAAQISVTVQQLNEIILLQASLKSAWAALPPSMQFSEDRAQLMLNDEIIGDLRAILQQQRAEQEQKAKEAATQKRMSGLYSLGYSAGTTASALMQGAKPGAKRTLSGLFSVVDEASGILHDQISNVAGAPGAAYSATKRAGTVVARVISSGLTKVATAIKTAKDTTSEWFTKKFGALFGVLNRVIRYPLDKMKSAGSFLGKIISWGSLLTSVLIPVVQGLYKQLSDKFSTDFVLEQLAGARDWLFDKLKSINLDAIAEKLGDAKEWVTEKFGSVRQWLSENMDSARTWLWEKLKSALSFLPGIGKKFASDVTTGASSSSIGDAYKSYKEAGPLTRWMHEMDLRRQLSVVDGNTIPDELRAKLEADGFKISAPIGKTLRPLGTTGTATRATATTPGTVSSVSNGAPADGPGAKPVTAMPKPAATPEASGAVEGTQTAGAASLPGVMSIPRSMVDDPINAFNLGVIA